MTVYLEAKEGYPYVNTFPFVITEAVVMPQNCMKWQYHSTIKHLVRLAVRQ